MPKKIIALFICWKKCLVTVVSSLMELANNCTPKFFTWIEIFLHMYASLGVWKIII